MKLSKPLLKKIALIGGGVFIAMTLLLWLALPRILQSQAEQFVSEKTGHRLSMARPEFNPFALRLRLSALQLVQPDGEPLLVFDELIVDLSAASLPLRALVFDDIRLTGPELTLIQQADGGLNWGPFLASLKSPEAPPEEKKALPRFDIRHFELAGGRVAFADRRDGKDFSTRVEPLEITLTDVSTLPDDSGKFSLQAKTAIGADLTLAGEANLNPLAFSGNVEMKGLALEHLAPYLKGALPGTPKGTADFAARYRVANDGKQLDTVIEDIDVSLSGLHLPLAANGAGVSIGNVRLKEGRYDLAQQQLAVAGVTLDNAQLLLPRIERSVSLSRISLEDARVNLGERQASLAKFSIAEGQVHGTRSADGKLPIVEALQALAGGSKSSAEKAPADASAKPWQFRLEKLDVSDLGVSLRDEGVSPAGGVALEKVALSVEGISQDLSQPLPVQLAFKVASGGQFEAAGKYTPAGALADFKLKLTDLSLKPAEAYIASKAHVQFASGRVSSEGQLLMDSKGPTYRGDLSVRDLRINEAGTKNVLLAWKNFSTGSLTATPRRLDISELRLNGLDTKLIIDKDKVVNFKKVLRTGAAEAAPAPSGKKDGFLVNVDRLRFYNGEMYFADESLMLPFGTRIHGLRGSMSHLSSQPGGVHGQLELEGEVDEYGMARAVGEVDLFDPTGFMDIRVLFRNVEMTRLTPYMATFAGRKIDSGKLSLDLQYKIKQRQLQGENQVIVDRMKLGERVESPTAKDLPLDLAIAILEDSDGRIDLGLPVAGSLDDPEFSYGSIVWKAITNVLTKIVTAPFRALGALFGGGEKLDSIVFEAGVGQLTPPEREKLTKVASAMSKRPGLLLGISGTYAEADRVALQDVQLRRTILKQIGERVNEARDPGPLSTALPKVRSALEDLYGQRYGASDLAALKEGFRQANPGQLEENVAGKMMSRFSGLLREKKTLSEAEVGQLKGVDFYGLLYERVRAKEAVGDARLQALAQARAEFAVNTLKSAGVAAERIQLRAAEKAEPDEGNVPLKLALEAAPKN
ncbi:MAG: DUF748 domain-containing protein [Rhodocyclaceae bacterium]|nr:DUF748 domain-containing protein [Rhodocyclaceae bacterium]MDZ4216547.1 DUF748 domain-containing protein [Rhodocyclaceae bacterium]